MKTLFLFSFLTLATILFGQKVEQQSTSMSLGSQNAYYIVIEGADKDLLEDVWEAYVKEYGKSKYNKKANEYVTDKANVALINGSSPVTLYARHDEGKNQSTTFLWVDLGGAFANGGDYKTQSEGIETFLKDFWIMARKKVVAKELEMQEKKAKDLNKDLTKLESKKKDYEEEIEKCKLKIAEAEKNIELNKTSQANKKLEIEAQKKVVQEVTDKLNGIGKSM